MRRVRSRPTSSDGYAVAVEWDYDGVAAAYDARPPYATEALSACLDATGLAAGARVCDVGAGTGHATLPLLARGLAVVAAEPSASMRVRGVARTAGFGAVTWVAAVAEALPFAAATFRLVSFGSSFNVVDRPRALAESARVLHPGGFLLCLWNHRRLDDPLQARIEAAIHARVPGYGYGTRREDPTPVLVASRLFGRIHGVEAGSVARVRVDRWLEAWRSHLTLRRQAGARLGSVLAAIADVIGGGPGDEIVVPYVTRAWIAGRRW